MYLWHLVGGLSGGPTEFRNLQLRLCHKEHSTDFTISNVLCSMLCSIVDITGGLLNPTQRSSSIILDAE